MQTHILQLASRPFESIRNGNKVIESRLYDEKRRLIKVGDALVFHNRANQHETIQATVIELIRHDTFRELFMSNDPMLFGGVSEDVLETQIKVFYTDEDERRYGVLGIRFVIS